MNNDLFNEEAIMIQKIFRGFLTRKWISKSKDRFNGQLITSEHPIKVFPNFLLFEHSGSGKGRIDYNRKSLMRHVIDGRCNDNKPGNPCFRNIVIQKTHSLWENVEGNAKFDPNKQYRVLLTHDNTAEYPIQVLPDFLLFEHSGSGKGRIDYNNKSLMRHVIDGNCNQNKPGNPCYRNVIVQMCDSPWENIEVNDDLFDGHKEYRVLHHNTAEYPIQVLPNSLIFEHSGSGKGRIDYDNKSLMRHVIDGNCIQNKPGNPNFSNVVIQVRRKRWYYVTGAEAHETFDKDKQYRVLHDGKGIIDTGIKPLCIMEIFDLHQKYKKNTIHEEKVIMIQKICRGYLTRLKLLRLFTNAADEFRGGRTTLCETLAKYDEVLERIKETEKKIKRNEIRNKVLFAYRMAVFVGTIINSENKPSPAVRRREIWAQDAARNPTPVPTPVPTPIPVYRNDNGGGLFVGATLGGMLAARYVMDNLSFSASGDVHGRFSIGASVRF